MYQGIVISGFGGQGALSAGMLIAHAGLIDDKNVSWIPSYGPEMRGGTVNCHVTVSDRPIGSPILNQITTLIAMNFASLERFGNMVVNNGLIIVDSSLVNIPSKFFSYNIIEVPSTKIATDMNAAKLSNIVLLGKLVSTTNVVSKYAIIHALEEVLPPSKHHLIPMEIEAFEAGMNYK